MVLQIFNAFLKTAIYGCMIIGKNENSRNQTKQKWAKMILKSFGFSVEIIGQQPPMGTQILVGNHISYLDIVILMSAVPEIAFIAKDDLKKWPIIGAAATVAGTIFVNRSTSYGKKKFLDQIINQLNEKNKSIAIFPSGTTALYEEKPWKKGAFKIAKQAQVPVQLFRIDYQPLRESAYIDDDNLLSSMYRLSKIKNKSASLQWLGRFEQIDEPYLFAEDLRQKVISKSKTETRNEAT